MNLPASLLGTLGLALASLGISGCTTGAAAPSDPNAPTVEGQIVPVHGHPVQGPDGRDPCPACGMG